MSASLLVKPSSAVVGTPQPDMEVRGSKSQAHAFELIGQFMCLCVLNVNWCVCPYLVFVSHGVSFAGQSDLRVWVGTKGFIYCGLSHPPQILYSEALNKDIDSSRVW